MCVYNDADALDRTINSILTQSMADFEFIIVNDGSTDNSQAILEAAAATDARIKIIKQANQGLTKALIAGCQQASAAYIARQDNGDLSSSNRLDKQLSFLEAHHSCVMVSCSTAFTGPKAEILYTVVQSEQEAQTGLQQDSVETFSGPPHHGSVMFRSKTYDLVKGYRAAFRVAQDIDLWTRLTEHGAHHSLPQVMYRAAVARNSISMLHRGQQLLATQAIINGRKARESGGNDQAVIDDYLMVSDNGRKTLKKPNKADADYYYFIASNLQMTNLNASLDYLKIALKHNPWHVKAAIKFVIGKTCNLFNNKTFKK